MNGWIAVDVVFQVIVCQAGFFGAVSLVGLKQQVSLMTAFCALCRVLQGVYSDTWWPVRQSALALLDHHEFEITSQI